jgi:serine/threonine protein kinase
VRESRAAAAVDHPHIIPVFEASEADGVLFIAMRYVAGGDVRGLMRREGRLAPARVMAIISPVASALDAAHAAGLVHRDVKPANMLIDTSPGRPDHVYLADFGLSKGYLAAGTLTMTGHSLGTPAYMAPEQLEGQTVDGRADQFTLACAAFELLTGEPPFERDQEKSASYAQLHVTPPALTSRRPDLPPSADGVFAKALAKSPDNRYASCRDFAEALRRAFALDSYGQDTISPGKATCLPRSRFRHPEAGRLTVSRPTPWARFRVMRGQRTDGLSLPCLVPAVPELVLVMDTRPRRARLGAAAFPS